MTSSHEFIRRQRVLSDFGAFVLDCDDLTTILRRGCRLVADALGTGLAKVVEIEAGGETAVVRAGAGWRSPVEGIVRVRLDERSSEAFAIALGEPLVTTDIATETRFDFPDFMRDEGVRAIVNVPILLPGRKPYGLLQVDAREPRDFGEEEIEFLRGYAAVLGPVIDRLMKLRELAHTTERYRLIVENAREHAILLTDPDDRITDWLPGAEAVFGWTAEEAVGQPGAMLFTPEDRAAGADDAEVEQARRDGWAPNLRWHVRKDGVRVFIDGTVTALRAPDGSVEGFMKIGQDVTERRRAEETRLTNEERLSLATEIAQLGTWDWDMVADTIRWSDEHYRLDGYEVGEVEPSFEAWSSRIHPDDFEATTRALFAARDERTPYVVEFRSVHPDGAVVWCSALGRFFYDEDGRPVRMIGAMRDVTEQREWGNRQRLLVDELQHRTRNLMGVVRSVAEKTLRTSVDLADFQPRFRDRIAALARVQGLLSRLADLDRVTFDDLLNSELMAMGGRSDAVALDGPPGIKLRSSSVQILALAIHELATNAIKYGALSQPDATLTIAWHLAPDPASGLPWLHIDWRERGVTTPGGDARPAQGGQGRELIERALPYQLGARTRFALEDGGLHCTMAVPISTRGGGGTA